MKINPCIKDFYKIIKKPLFVKTSGKIRNHEKLKILLEKKTQALVLSRSAYSKNYYKNMRQEISKIDKFCEINFNFFLKKNKFSKKSKICDFGCGYGNYFNIINKFSSQLYGVEINKKKINYLKNKHPLKKKIIFKKSL